MQIWGMPDLQNIPFKPSANHRNVSKSRIFFIQRYLKKYNEIIYFLQILEIK